MARVFDPLVFQPSVFQVGTLDVATLDVATKRRKWLSLSVPASGRVGGVSAFAVSRDSAGILLAVRDKAAPQFAVSRDAEGLLLSAHPTVPMRFYVSAAVLTLFDDGSNFAIVSGAWDAVGLDTCDFECFIAEPGANFTENWSGNNVVMLSSRWAYPEVFTPNEHWLSLGVKTTHRPASETDNEGTSAIWDIPNDAQIIDSGWFIPGYWFIFRAPVRVDELGAPTDPENYLEWDPGMQYYGWGFHLPSYCTHNGTYWYCVYGNVGIEPGSDGTYWMPQIFGGLRRSYGLHAYYDLHVRPDYNGWVDCQLAHNYVTAPLLYSPAPALETPSNYPQWEPLP